KLIPLKDKGFETKRAFLGELKKMLSEEELKRFQGRILIHARSGGRQREELDDLVEDVLRRSRGEGLPQTDVLSLHEALEALAAEHPRVAEVLELRFFGDRKMAEIAEILGVSKSAVERDQEFGLDKLYVSLSPKNSKGAP